MVRPDYRGCLLRLNDTDWQSQASFPGDSPSLGYSDDLMAVHPKGQVDYFNFRIPALSDHPWTLPPQVKSMLEEP